MPRFDAVLVIAVWVEIDADIAAAAANYFCGDRFTLVPSHLTIDDSCDFARQIIPIRAAAASEQQANWPVQRRCGGFVVAPLCQRCKDCIGETIKSGVCVELIAAMLSAFDHIMVDRKFVFLVDRLQFMRLLRWHLRIGVAVDQPQRWVVLIDVRHRAGQSSDFRYVKWLSAQQ